MKSENYMPSHQYDRAGRFLESKGQSALRKHARSGSQTGTGLLCLGTLFRITCAALGASSHIITTTMGTAGPAARARFAPLVSLFRHKLLRFKIDLSLG